MNETAREFIKIAYDAMRRAYNHQVGMKNGALNVENLDKDEVKKIGEVLQMVGDLSRMA